MMSNLFSIRTCSVLCNSGLAPHRVHLSEHFHSPNTNPFEVLDLIERRTWNSKLTMEKGNWPLCINNKPPKRVLDSSVTPSLPKNWYCEEWYNLLDLYQKSDLNTAEIKALPNIMSVPFRRFLKVE